MDRDARHYATWEVKSLERMIAQNLPIRVMAERLGKSEGSIKYKRRTLPSWVRRKPYRSWTPTEDADVERRLETKESFGQIAKTYPGVTRNQIAALSKKFKKRKRRATQQTPSSHAPCVAGE